MRFLSPQRTHVILFFMGLVFRADFSNAIKNFLMHFNNNTILLLFQKASNQYSTDQSIFV